MRTKRRLVVIVTTALACIVAGCSNGPGVGDARLKKEVYAMQTAPDEMYRARREFFNEHAEEWSDMWYKDQMTGRHDKYKKDFERLFSLLPLKSGDHVLDAGCGAGVLVPFILPRITAAGVLYELDFAEKMIEVNRRLNKAENIRFMVQDMETAALGNASCDIVICFSAFPHFQDKEKALKNITRILKRGGALVVAHFDSSQAINKHHGSHAAVMHDLLPDEATMRSMMEKAGLETGVFIDEPGFYCVIARK